MKTRTGSPVPRGLETAAVAHYHRRSGATQQLGVLEVDEQAWTITLGNFPGVRVTYRWTMRSDTGGFRFLEVEDQGGAA